MVSIEQLDDPIWEYVLATKLTPYMNKVRDFWEHIADIEIKGTGVYPIVEQGCPGLMYRVTNTPVRSPIKNVQVFPFVPVSYLQITGVSGGSSKMVTRVCADNKFKMEEFTIIEKSNLPSTYHQGQFIAFVPTVVLEGVQPLGKWVYMNAVEMLALAKDTVPNSVKQKVIKYI